MNSAAIKIALEPGKPILIETPDGNLLLELGTEKKLRDCKLTVRDVTFPETVIYPFLEACIASKDGCTKATKAIAAFTCSACGNSYYGVPLFEPGRCLACGPLKGCAP